MKHDSVHCGCVSDGCVIKLKVLKFKVRVCQHNSSIKRLVDAHRLDPFDLWQKGFSLYRFELKKKMNLKSL